MSENALKRITLVLARGYGNRFDPNIQLSLEAIHELLEVCFPNHDYGIKTVHLYLSRLYTGGLVRVVPGSERSRYQLTELGFQAAERHWTIRFSKLGYGGPVTADPIAAAPQAPLDTDVGRVTTAAWLDQNSSEAASAA